jgi:hypothetical protein
VKRLSRRISPDERIAVLETALQGLPAEARQSADPDVTEELAALPVAAPM